MFVTVDGFFNESQNVTSSWSIRKAINQFFCQQFFLFFVKKVFSFEFPAFKLLFFNGPTATSFWLFLVSSNKHYNFYKKYL